MFLLWCVPCCLSDLAFGVLVAHQASPHLYLALDPVVVDQTCSVQSGSSSTAGEFQTPGVGHERTLKWEGPSTLGCARRNAKQHAVLDFFLVLFKADKFDMFIVDRQTDRQIER